jgi:hypothetical protein
MDKEAREAIAKLTHLIEQQITLAGNHLHGAAIKPELAAIRKSLGSAEAPVPSFTPVPNATLPHGVNPPDVEVLPPAIAISRGRAGLPIMSPAANVELVGCKGCNRTPDELVSHGHAPECESIKAAPVVSAAQ